MAPAALAGASEHNAMHGTRPRCDCSIWARNALSAEGIQRCQPSRNRLATSDRAPQRVFRALRSCSLAKRGNASLNDRFAAKCAGLTRLPRRPPDQHNEAWRRKRGFSRGRGERQAIAQHVLSCRNEFATIDLGRFGAQPESTPRTVW